MSQYVYILSNPSMSGLIKIGKTNNPKRRISELSRETGVPTPFEFEIVFEVDDCSKREGASHRALKKYRLEGKEFFRISVQEALKLILPVMGEYSIFLTKSDHDVPAIKAELGRRAEEEAKRRAEAKRWREEDAKRRAEEEVERSAMAEAKRGKEGDAKCRVEEEVERRAAVIVVPKQSNSESDGFWGGFGSIFFVFMLIFVWANSRDADKREYPQNPEMPIKTSVDNTPPPISSLDQKFANGLFHEVINVARSEGVANSDLNTVGMAYYQSSDYENALKWFRLAEQAYPSDANIKVNIAETFFRLGDFQQALAQYLAVQSTAPNTPLVSDRINNLQLKIQQDLASKVQTAPTPTYEAQAYSNRYESKSASSPQLSSDKSVAASEHLFDVERTERMNMLAEQAAIERKKETDRILAEERAREQSVVERHKQTEINQSRNEDYQDWLSAQQQRARDEAFKSLPMNDPDRRYVTP